MFIRTTNGTPEIYTIGQLRRDNPNVSFPKDIPADVLADFGVYPVKRTPAPQIDSKTRMHKQDIVLVGGEWTQVWNTVELPLDQASENVRSYRDALLQESDWVVAKAYERGEPVPSDWASYRQALRDVTAQDGFPYSVTWPTKPE